jgi:hypothetical protein
VHTRQALFSPCEELWRERNLLPINQDSRVDSEWFGSMDQGLRNSDQYGNREKTDNK